MYELETYSAVGRNHHDQQYSNTAARNPLDTKYHLTRDLSTEHDITRIATLGMCRKCPSVTIRVHNVSLQPRVLDVDGTICVKFNGHNSQSEGVMRQGPGLRWEKEE